MPAQHPLAHGDDEQAYVRAFQQLVGAVFRLNGQLLATAEQLVAGTGVTTTQ